MGLFAGQKWCIPGNPGNTLSGHHLSVGNPSVCSQGMHCQVLWSRMLGLGRGGQRQLTIPNKHQALVSPSEHKLMRQTMPDELNYKTKPLILTREGSKKTDATPNGSAAGACSCKSHFSQNRVQNQTLTPGPSPKNVRNVIANAPGKLLAPEGSFWKSTF